MTPTRFAIALLAALPVLPTVVPQTSPYVEMENREIKTLSAEDVEQLSAGHGWGLSLAAELNGVPGPRHLLELEEPLGLSPAQSSAIEKLYDEMKQHAVPLGLQLIRLERELDRRFAERSIDDETLDRLLTEIADTRRRLRKTHLSAHLATLPLLRDDQIEAYSRLRGYDSDPCRSVPPGHDPVLWRSHNHCD
jgi:hypothetical protein